MTPTRRALLAVLPAAGCAGLPDEARPALLVETTLAGATLRIEGAAQFAGAISSLRHRGMEYVNSADHGRLFQGAIAYDARYECLNPTQAGGSRDRLNLARRSSSRLLEAQVIGDGFAVTTRMAWWLRPGMSCDVPGEGRAPVENTGRTSDTIYTARHRFGALPADNAVAVSIRYDSPRAWRSAVVEAMTLYAPPVFDTFHSLDLATGTLTLEPTLSPDERAPPIVVSTADGAHAFAFVSRTPGATYGRWRFSDTSKISLAYRPPPPFTGQFACEAAWVIGTRDQVVAGVRAVAAGV
jgi:hypothetical protein